MADQEYHATGAETSRLEEQLQIAALIAALLVIPVVFLQASKDNTLSTIGNWSGLVIWAFFVFEVVVLLRRSDARVAWLRGHLLELVVVVASAPVFLVGSGAESLLSASPLLILPRLLKIGKVAKVVKIGKLLKIARIVRNDESVPRWVDKVALLFVGLIVIALLGMLLDGKAKNPIDGWQYWIDVWR